MKKKKLCLLLVCSIVCILPDSSLGGSTGAESKVEARVTHDGSTVSAMLAKFGLGPLTHCVSCDMGVNMDNVCSLAPRDHLPVCWGYEKDCAQEKALFVPQCEPPAKPWYDYAALLY